MAIYRLSADIVRRSVGRTVTAAAAYRAGVLIVDARTGLAFDYRRRRGVRDAAILAPENAPAWMRDRVRLWNGIEQSEKRKDAQLARDIELALPFELTHAERRELVHGFVRAAFVGAGMVADVAIHLPDRAGDQRNHHAHILLTMRAIEGESFGPKVRAWNDPALFDQWRALWAEHVNRALEIAGERARVDHRSLAAQGVMRVAQIHLGRNVIEMERRGLAPDRAALARDIDAANAALDVPPVIDALQSPGMFRRVARMLTRRRLWRSVAVIFGSGKIPKGALRHCRGNARAEDRIALVRRGSTTGFVNSSQHG